MTLPKIFDHDLKETFIGCWNSGGAIKDIAYILGVSVATVRFNIKYLLEKGSILKRDIPNRPVSKYLQRPNMIADTTQGTEAKRICLKCKKSFPSSHIGNRRCPPCLNLGNRY